MNESACAHGVPFAEPCHTGDCFRDGQEDKAVLVHAFIQRHLAGGADNYAIALLLEKAGYTFRDYVTLSLPSRRNPIAPRVIVGCWHKGHL